MGVDFGVKYVEVIEILVLEDKIGLEMYRIGVRKIDSFRDWFLWE